MNIISKKLLVKVMILKLINKFYIDNNFLFFYNNVYLYYLYNSYFHKTYLEQNNYIRITI